MSPHLYSTRLLSSLGLAVLAATCLAFTARAADFTWHFVSPTPTGNALRRVAFLNDRFVAIGDAGTLLTSTDGTTWTDQTLPATYNLAAITYGNGRYVVSDDRSGLYTSTDGVQWTTSQPALYYYWAGGRTALLASGNGIFFRLMTTSSASTISAQISADGLAWQPVDPPSSVSNPLSLVFAQGRFAASYWDGSVWSSADGRIWTKVITGNGLTSAEITAGNNVFLFPRADAPCLRSTDGLTWAAPDNAPILTQIAFLNGAFLAREKSTDALLQSADGLTWTTFASSPSNYTILRSTYGHGVYLALTDTAPAELLLSTDGFSWTKLTQHPAPMPSAGAPIVYGNGVFLAPGLRSTDGAHWSTDTFTTSGSTTNPTVLYFCRDRFIVYQDGAFYVSTDGRTGRKIPTAIDPTKAYYPPLYALEKFIIPSAEGPLVSTDGEIWTRDTTLINFDAAIVYGDGLFVRTDFAHIDTSPDGINWTNRYTYAPSAPYATEYHETLGRPIYGNGYFIVGGGRTDSHGNFADTLMTSSDGITWTTPAKYPNGIHALGFANGVFVSQSRPEDSGRAAPHASNPLASPQFNLSLDGVNWTSIPMPTGSPVTCFAGNDDVFLASATNGLLMTSFPARVPPPVGAITSFGSPALARGSSITLNAPVGSRPVTYQWRRNGVTLVGATEPSLFVNSPGTYEVVLTNAVGSTVSLPLVVTLDDSWLANVSSRAWVGTGEDVLIQGFVVRADHGNIEVLARAIGPSLVPLGVSDVLANPYLELRRAGQADEISHNDNWGDAGQSSWIGTTFHTVGAFDLPVGSNDSALTATLPTGVYSFPVKGVLDGTGVALTELYDASPLGRIVNLSARARVGSGDRTLIAGFVVAGGKPLRVLIRAVGPTLATQGIASPLGNPKLTLYDVAGHEIHNNDQWNAAANLADLRAATTATGAFPLLEGSNDAAMLETLEPGVYSAHVTSVDGSPGIALVEIYEAP